MEMDLDGLLAGLHLLIGVTLFLFGLEKTLFALKNLLGEQAKQRIGLLTDHGWQGVATGAWASVMLLSGGVTLEMVSSLATLNLISFAQGIRVILGSEIGAAVMVLLLTLPIAAFAGLPMIAGLFLFYTNINARYKTLGHLLFGLGVLFFAIATMGAILAPMRHAPVWQMITQALSLPWFGLPVTILLTLLLRSSTATMGILLMLAAGDLVPLSTGLLMVMGANLGALFAVLIHARHQSGVTLGLAIAFALAKAVGALGVFWWLPQLATWLPQTVWTPYLMVFFHIFINTISALLLFPLTGWVVRFCTWIAPEQYSEEVEETGFNNHYWPQYLDDTLITTPTLALAMARREVKLITRLLEEMHAMIPEAVFVGDLQKIAKLRKMDDRVDEIHQAITRYLARISSANPSSQAVGELMDTMTVINELESIGDIIENNFSHLAEVCARNRMVLSQEILTTLGEYHQVVHQALLNAAAAYLANNLPLAVKVMGLKDAVGAMDAKCRMQQMHSLQTTQEGHEPGQEDFAFYTLQMDLYENFKRIYYHAKRIAKVVAKT